MAENTSETTEGPGCGVGRKFRSSWPGIHEIYCCLSVGHCRIVSAVTVRPALAPHGVGAALSFGTRSAFGASQPGPAGRKPAQGASAWWIDTSTQHPLGDTSIDWVDPAQLATGSSVGLGREQVRNYWLV